MIFHRVIHYWAHMNNWNGILRGLMEVRVLIIE